jgi:hypothetical protein
VAGATPCLEMGWLDHPIFGQGVAEPAVWGWPKPPQARKGPKRPKKKKKNEKMGLGFWGWPDHPQGPGGGFGHPLRPVGGVPKPPPSPRGWFGHPQRPKPIFPFFFFFGLSGWPDHPQRPGVASATPIRPVRPPLGQKWGGPATPFLGKEWLQPPRDSPFFFFFFSFQFPSFFLKKKKKLKPKIPKITPFWAKRRCFG